MTTFRALSLSLLTTSLLTISSVGHADKDPFASRILSASMQSARIERANIHIEKKAVLTAKAPDKAPASSPSKAVAVAVAGIKAPVSAPHLLSAPTLVAKHPILPIPRAGLGKASMDRP